MKNKLLFFICLFIGVNTLFSQKKNAQNNLKQDSIFLRKIYTECLENGEAYDNLRSLCKDVGSRLSGSLGAQMAVLWGKQMLEKYPFDSVYLQEIMVPHWVRGTKEKGYVIDEKGNIRSLTLLALGGSVGTNGILQGEVVLFKTLDELKNANRSVVEGKIVFVAQAMNQNATNAFDAYGNNYEIRGHSASIASKKGAKAVLIRSLSMSENNYPNTGVMRYDKDSPAIPAAALSTADATQLENYLSTNKKATIYLEMDCRMLPDEKSYNVIAEIKGQKFPNSIITIGGHLDSWDVSEGAHDDGAGIVQSMEAVRVLKSLNYSPQHTIRVVFFMNEENGNRGGEAYATFGKQKGENHIFAIESDEGGFTPRGFSFDGTDKKFQFISSYFALFTPYLIHLLERGYSGVDITPLKSQFNAIGLLELIPDSQRYFDIHHNANDVFENINKRELHLGAATLSALIYLLDKNWTED